MNVSWGTPCSEAHRYAYTCPCAHLAPHTLLLRRPMLVFGSSVEGTAARSCWRCKGGDAPHGAPIIPVTPGTMRTSVPPRAASVQCARGRARAGRVHAHHRRALLLRRRPRRRPALHQARPLRFARIAHHPRKLLLVAFVFQGSRSGWGFPTGFPLSYGSCPSSTRSAPSPPTVATPCAPSGAPLVVCAHSPSPTEASPGSIRLSGFKVRVKVSYGVFPEFMFHAHL